MSQHRGVLELLLARGHDHEQPLGRGPASQVRHEPQRQLVGPVKVFQHEKQRVTGRQAHQEPGDRLEQAPVVDLGRQGMRGRRRDFWQQPRKLDAPGRTERLESLVVVVDLTHPQRVDDGTEQQDLVALVRPAQQHVSVASSRVGDQLLD